MLVIWLAAQVLPPIVAQPGPALREQMRIEAHRKAELQAEVNGLRWADCIQRRKIALRASREIIGDIVTAVLAGCATEQRAYQNALPMRFDYAAQVVAGARQGYSDALTGFYVEDRLKRARR